MLWLSDLSQWLVDIRNLTEWKKNMTAEFDALKAKVEELQAYAIETDASLDKAIYDIDELKKQIDAGSDAAGMLALVDSITKTLTDAKSSTYTPPAAN